MTRPPDMTWDYPGLAYCGGVIGSILAVAHNIFAIRSGTFDATYPFRHVLTEAVLFAAVGAILAVVCGAIYRLLLHRL